MYELSDGAGNPEGEAVPLVDPLNETGGVLCDDVFELAEQRFERRLAEVEGRLVAALSAFEVRIGERLRARETRLLRWIVGLSLAQIGLLLGILFAVFRL